MKNIIKKLLVATAAFIVMSGSLGVGTLRVLAEQYYGWEDGKHEKPSFLYITPKSNPKRDFSDEFIVYCFNRDKHYPDIWDSYMPADLPVYDRLTGTSELFKKNASKAREVLDIEKSLVAVLSKGYPNVKRIQGLDPTSSRIVTQLAIWYFSDSLDSPEYVIGRKLSEDEDKAYKYLIQYPERLLP